MNILRSLCLSAALIASGLSASGQIAAGLLWPGATTAISGGTNKAMALTTNGYVRLDIPKSSELTLYCQYKFLNVPGAGDATSIRIDLYRGIDASTRETNKWQTWVVAGNSTTPQSEVTNINVASVPYLWARVINQSTNSHATNLFLLYGGKR